MEENQYSYHAFLSFTVYIFNTKKDHSVSVLAVDKAVKGRTISLLANIQAVLPPKHSYLLHAHCYLCFCCILVNECSSYFLTYDKILVIFTLYHKCYMELSPLAEYSYKYHRDLSYLDYTFSMEKQSLGNIYH